MNPRDIPLSLINRHPLNSNAMPADRFEMLVAHLARTGRYPPLIVRPLPSKPDDEAPRVVGVREPAYQLLDGHHRLAALTRLGHAAARCDVWDVDDAEALLLLATLNRLEGEDDAKKRGHLLAALHAAHGAEREEALQSLASQLPDGLTRMRSLIALREPPAALNANPAPTAMRHAVHFFLDEAERRELLSRLRTIGGTRETALMSLVRRIE